STANGPWGVGKYTYDPLGNLTKREEVTTLTTRTVTTTIVPATNRVESVQDGGVLRGYTPDSRGNVTAGGIHSFTLNYDNQPVTVSGADVGSFVYDGNLRRIKQVIDGKTIYSV